MPATSYSQNPCYFLTLTVVDWVDIFIRPVYKNIIVNALNYFISEKGLVVNAWCLMSNHLHLIGNAKETYLWTYLLRELKRFISKDVFATINEKTEPDCRREWMMKIFESPVNVTKHVGKYHFWQEGNHPVFLNGDDPAMIMDRIDFIHDNPIRCLIVHDAESYIYSSAMDYAGKQGLVNVTVFNPLALKEKK